MRDNDAPLLLDSTRLIWRRWAGIRPTGIDRLCLAWLGHYAERSQAVLVYHQAQRILNRSASRALFDLLANTPDDATPATRNRFRRKLLALAARHSLSLVRSLPGRGRLWLNVGHTGLDIDGLADWCRKSAIQPVFLVHDLIPITHPQFCRAGEYDRHVRRMRTVLDIGDGLIANSQQTLNAMAEFAAVEGKPLPPSLVAWLGTEEHFGRISQTSLDANSNNADFIILGTIEGRKNHKLLLDVWERLWRIHGQNAPRLLIIGRRGWACDDVLARLDQRSFGDRVVETGPLEDSEIAALLANARALLFPSFVEGYGLPLIEAMAAGIPVIASDLPVFQEIGQAVPDLLPPADIDAWSSAIMDYAASSSTRRSAQQARLATFVAPSWAEHFERVDRFLEAL